MRRLTLPLAVAAATLLGGCEAWQEFVDTQPLSPDFQANRSTPASAVGVERMFETTQNWSDDVRAGFWHLDQGSLAIPYDLARAVEVANGEALFLSHGNVARYRYVPQNAGGLNPDGLPLGFTKSKPGFDGQEYLGMTCSACHSTVMTYEGTGLLIDGAPTMGDFQGFWYAYTDALKANMDGEKFDRLAGRLLGEAPSAADTRALKRRLGAAHKRMATRLKLNQTDVAYGYGRVDAIGHIYNAVASANLGIPRNAAPPNAPVSYPFLWGTHQSNVVQWNGFAPNAPLDPNIRIAGPLIRNFGEVLGVFGEIDLRKGSRNRAETYPNSVRIENLLTVEEWLERLAPPAWPEDILGDIDPDLAVRGAGVYRDRQLGNCAGCHEVARDPFACYNAVMVPLKAVGTDPGQAENSLREARTGPLAGRYAGLAPPLGEDRLPRKAPVLDILKHEIVRAAMHDVKRRKLRSLRVLVSGIRQERDEEKCAVTPTGVGDLRSYKARPLNGIWATAPYLHNGSVPSLAALLTAEAERPETFTLGGWEYDPVDVGYAPYEGPNAFTFDTRLEGNSNQGHTWGTDLSPENKAALIEYLKTL
ncbi:MAG: di-heme-cytochrome C peroxidase [Pseudomonadota bacterium]